MLTHVSSFLTSKFLKVADVAGNRVALSGFSSLPERKFLPENVRLNLPFARASCKLENEAYLILFFGTIGSFKQVQ